MPRKFREKIRNREALAIDPRADLLDLLMGGAPKENETIGGAIVVHVCGPLEQRDCGFGDSYEQIRQRFDAALAEEPEAIILRIDSPGGVVAGLNEFVAAMRKAKEAAGVYVIAYADELIASAAYALSCVADEIVTPASGIVGSIGVIALLCDQVEADKKAGLNYVTITSGARKDDGHPHTAISDGAIAAETERVDDLARQFFDLVRDARGFDPEPLQAGVFTGEKAVEKGVADYVMGWDDLVAQFALAESGTRVSPSTEVAQPGTRARGSLGETPMPKLKALIAAKKAALKSAKGAQKAALQNEIASLQFALASLNSAPSAAYKKTTKTETKEEKTDDEMDDEEEAKHDEPDGDEASAEDDGQDAKMADEDEESGDEDESAEDDEPKKDAKKAKTSAGTLAALKAQAARTADAEARLAAIEKERAQERKLAKIGAALKARHISPSEAKTLNAKSTAFVNDYLSMRNTPIVGGDDESPRPAANSRELSDAEQRLQRDAFAAVGLDPDKAKPAALTNGGPPKESAVVQLSDLVNKGN